MTDFIADFEQHLRQLDRAPATIAAYLETLRRMDRELESGLVHALPEELTAWLCNENWSKATRHQRRAAVVAFFTFASDPKRRTRISYNPATDLPTVSVPDGRPRPVPLRLVEDLLLKALEPFQTWFKIALFGGARCVEISNLDREHITREEMALLGKGGRIRSVPVHELIWEAVEGLPAGPIAVASDGLRLTREEVSRLGNRHLGQLGFDFTMHQLRHTFGTEAYEASGHDLRVVQELLGHASVATTQIYVAVRKENKVRAVAGLSVAAARRP